MKQCSNDKRVIFCYPIEETETNVPVSKDKAGKYSMTRQWLVMVLLLVIALAPVAILTFTTMEIAVDSMFSQIQAENVAAVNGFRGQIFRDFQERTGLARAISEIPKTVRAVANEDLLPANEDMKNVTLVDRNIERAFILKRNGEPWAAYPTEMNEEYKEHYRDEPWFQEVLASGELRISSVFARVPRSETDPRSFMYFASPITVSGSIAAVVVLEYSARELQDVIQAASGSYLFLLDQNGKTIIHPYLPADNPVTDVYASVGLVQQAFATSDQVYSGMYRDPVTDTDMIGTFVPFINLGPHWVVVAQRPAAPVQESLAGVQLSILLLGGILTLVSLIIVGMLGYEARSNLKLTKELSDKNVKLRETDAIVRSSHDAIIGLAPDWTIRTWNTGAEVLYGLPDHHMIGQPFTYLLGTEHGEAFLAMKEKLQKGEDVSGEEITHKKPSGAEVPAALTLSRIPADDGSVAGYSCIIRDITAQKELEKTRKDFLSFVVHQLKGPVAAVKGTLELIMDGDYGAISDELKKQVALTQERVEGQVHLMNDILNTSRVERGVIELQRAITPVMTAVQRAMRDYVQPYKEKNLYLNVDEKNKDLQVNMDMEKVAEAISNAISNALKYTEKGGVTITVTSENGQAVVEVTDTGKGMDEAMIGKLFTRDKVMGHNTAAAGSSGLGLYIAKQFMELHGGGVTVRSKVGEGTTFRYELPLAGNEEPQKKV